MKRIPSPSLFQTSSPPFFTSKTHFIRKSLFLSQSRCYIGDNVQTVLYMTRTAQAQNKEEGRRSGVELYNIHKRISGEDDSFRLISLTEKEVVSPSMREVENKTLFYFLSTLVTLLLNCPSIISLII